MAQNFRPFIVGIGGTTKASSSPEKALRFALSLAEEQGAEVEIFAGPHIHLPMYSPDATERSPEAQRLVASFRRAHGIIVSTPCYHGSVSGLLKNALDYAEDMAHDEHPYFDGRAVGLIACGYGWQSTGVTLTALRSIVHSLRGWPTPIGVTMNSVTKMFDGDGSVIDDAAARQLTIMVRQVVDFAKMRCAAESAK